VAFGGARMKRQAKNTGKRSAKSTVGRGKRRRIPIEVRMPEPEKPAFFVDAEAAKQSKKWLDKPWNPAAGQVLIVSHAETPESRRKQQRVERQIARSAKRFGMTTWKRGDMYGGSSTSPTLKPTRVPDKETLEMLERCAKLKFADRRKDYWRPALNHWHQVPPKTARAYLHTAISTHRDVWDELEDKYIPRT
jgi:hypothetical protein